MPSLGAALALGVLFAVGTPWTASDVIERTASLTEPAVEHRRAGGAPVRPRGHPRSHQGGRPASPPVRGADHRGDLRRVQLRPRRGLPEGRPGPDAARCPRPPPSSASVIPTTPTRTSTRAPATCAPCSTPSRGTCRSRWPRTTRASRTWSATTASRPSRRRAQFVARVLRRMGDKKGAETVMAKPVPAPQWVARSPRSRAEGPDGERAVRVPEPRSADHDPGPAPRAGERAAAQLVLHDLEQRPSSRTWSPMPAVMQTADAGAADAGRPT